jgi:hypothetical protein
MKELILEDIVVKSDDEYANFGFTIFGKDVSFTPKTAAKQKEKRDKAKEKRDKAVAESKAAQEKERLNAELDYEAVKREAEQQQRMDDNNFNPLTVSESDAIQYNPKFKALKEKAIIDAEKAKKAAIEKGKRDKEAQEEAKKAQQQQIIAIGQLQGKQLLGVSSTGVPIFAENKNKKLLLYGGIGLAAILITVFVVLKNKQ